MLYGSNLRKYGTVPGGIQLESCADYSSKIQVAWFDSSPVLKGTQMNKNGGAEGVMPNRSDR